MQRIFLTLDRWITGTLTLSASILLFIALALVVYLWFARWIALPYISASETALRASLIWMTSCGLAAAFRFGALAGLRWSDRIVPALAYEFSHALNTAVTLVYLGIIAVFGYELVMQTADRTWGPLFIPIAWLVSAIPIGAVSSIIAVLAYYYDPQETAAEMEP